MKKSECIQDPNSCWNRARHDEEVFPLLGRDIAKPATLRFWAQTRIKLGKNQHSDEQISDALNLAKTLEREMLGPDWYGPVVGEANRQEIKDAIVESYIQMPYPSQVAMTHALAMDLQSAGDVKAQAARLAEALNNIDDYQLGEIYFNIWDNCDLTGSVIPGLSTEPAPEAAAA